MELKRALCPCITTLPPLSSPKKKCQLWAWHTLAWLHCLLDWIRWDRRLGG